MAKPDLRKLCAERLARDRCARIGTPERSIRQSFFFMALIRNSIWTNPPFRSSFLPNKKLDQRQQHNRVK